MIDTKFLRTVIWDETFLVSVIVDVGDTDKVIVDVTSLSVRIHDDENEIFSVIVLVLNTGSRIGE